MGTWRKDETLVGTPARQRAKEYWPARCCARFDSLPYPRFSVCLFAFSNRTCRWLRNADLARANISTWGRAKAKSPQKGKTMAHSLPQLTPELINWTWSHLPPAPVRVPTQPTLVHYEARVPHGGVCRGHWPSGHVLGPLTDRIIAKWYGPKVERKVKVKRTLSVREQVDKRRAMEYA